MTLYQKRLVMRKYDGAVFEPERRSHQRTTNPCTGRQSVGLPIKNCASPSQPHCASTHRSRCCFLLVSFKLKDLIFERDLFARSRLTDCKKRTKKSSVRAVLFVPSCWLGYKGDGESKTGSFVERGIESIEGGL